MLVCDVCKKPGNGRGDVLPSRRLKKLVCSRCWNRLGGLAAVIREWRGEVRRHHSPGEVENLRAIMRGEAEKARREERLH